MTGLSRSAETYVHWYDCRSGKVTKSTELKGLLGFPRRHMPVQTAIQQAEAESQGLRQALGIVSDYRQPAAVRWAVSGERADDHMLAGTSPPSRHNHVSGLVNAGQSRCAAADIDDRGMPGRAGQRQKIERGRRCFLEPTDLHLVFGCVNGLPMRLPIHHGRVTRPVWNTRSATRVRAASDANRHRASRSPSETTRDGAAWWNPTGKTAAISRHSRTRPG